MLLVLPDRIADQQGTLARLAGYADLVAKIMSHGPCAMIGMQRGAIPLIQFWNACLDVLRGAGVPHLERIRPGFPLALAPVPDAEIAAFLRAADLPRHAREPRDPSLSPVQQNALGPMIHFLGRGIFGKDYAGTFAAALKAQPGLRISSDSVRVRNLVGARERGEGGMGPYMIAKDALKAMGVSDDEDRYRLAWHMVIDAEDERHMVQALVANNYDVNGGYDNGIEQLQSMDDPESMIDRLRNEEEDARDPGALTRRLKRDGYLRDDDAEDDPPPPVRCGYLSEAEATVPPTLSKK